MKETDYPPYAKKMIQSMCPACGYHVAIPFYHGGFAPLTTLAWPTSQEEAVHMEKLPLNFVICTDCSHIYNLEFSYAKVPYSTKPNLMYNHGKLWQKHVTATQQLLLKHIPENPTIIEIGSGDGHFISALARQIQSKGQYLAFDPNGSAGHKTSSSPGCEITFYTDYFHAEKHIQAFQPDLIIARHLLEHLDNPSAFIQTMAFCAQQLQKPVYLFVEVPSVENALSSYRTEDFFYEHYSHFTLRSLSALFKRAQLSPEILANGYKGEVAYAYVALTNRQSLQTDECARNFAEHAHRADHSIQEQMTQLAESNQSIAIWGGTGKASAFMNRYGVDAVRFPTVIDSDPNKSGSYVPGTGQCIQSPETLKNKPVDVIVIATKWRAQDIALEIQERNIPCKQILAESDGKLMSLN